MFSTERSFLVSRTSQYEFPEHLPDTIPIRLRLFKLFGEVSRWNGGLSGARYDGMIPLAQYEGSMLHSRIKSSQRSIRGWIVRNLCRFGVLADEQLGIIWKIGWIVKVAVPGVFVCVTVVDMTLHLNCINAMLLDLYIGVNSDVDFDFKVMVDEGTWESMDWYEWKLESSPASISFIEDLEKLRVDSLEEETIRQSLPCVICLEDLDRFDTDVEEETDGDHQLILVTRFPCTHLYHRDCIVRWLETSHLCPWCRYETQTEEVPAEEVTSVEVADLPEPSRQLDWSVLLMIGGILTGTILCRLLKRSEG